MIWSVQSIVAQPVFDCLILFAVCQTSFSQLFRMRVMATPYIFFNFTKNIN